MGNEESSPIDESTPPRTLRARTLSAVAEYLTSGRVSKVCVLTGAGISTSAGIPDFRSPETGLYANLARLNLPYAEAVFDISYFREHPEAFYTLARELYPGRFRPTLTHSFLRLLDDKKLLLKLFTQNIDCLERAAGVPAARIVEAHGSFARQSCIECRAAYDQDALRAHVAAQTIPRCDACGGLVKPDIVFFGEALPGAFFENRMLPAQADLLIVLGTSLSVAPFSGLPDLVRAETPRVLVNKERVGDFGRMADDVMVLGDCDDGVRELAKACGWLEELEELWAKTAPAESAGSSNTVPDKGEVQDVEKSKDELLDEEIRKLTRDVEETLNLSKWHTESVRGESLQNESKVSVSSQEDRESNDESTRLEPGADDEKHGKKDVTTKPSDEPES
nr:NAD-dependent protein deacetylase hst2-1-like [Quercus suber]